MTSRRDITTPTSVLGHVLLVVGATLMLSQVLILERPHVDDLTLPVIAAGLLPLYVLVSLISRPDRTAPAVVPSPQRSGRAYSRRGDRR